MIIKGDVNGDGKIGVEDLMIGQAHILGLIQLNSNSQQALDVSNDGKTTSFDLLIMQRHILAVEILTEVIK